MSTENDPMAEIRATFFIECEELLEALQDGLQAMEEGGTDDETINIVFRAVHSIKGGAGAFGLEDLVRFAHRFESVLDAARSHQLEIDGEALSILFRAGDTLNDLVSAARDGEAADPALTEEAGKALDALIGADAPDGDGAEEEEVADFTPMTLSLDLGPLDAGEGAEAGAQADALPAPGEAGASGGGMECMEGAPAPAGSGFRIRFRPHSALFASGNEPLHLLRLLDEMGTMTTLCHAEDLPPLGEMDCEESYLHWDIFLETTEEENAIRELFDFVEDVCDLTISPLTEDDMAELVRHAEAIARDEVSPGGTAGDGALMAGDAPGSSGEVASGKPEAEGSPPPSAQKTRKAGGRSVGCGRNEGGSKAAGRGKASGAVKAKPTVRVDLERIDRLVNLVGELVINQAMISQSVEKAGLLTNPEIDSGLSEFMQLTRDIQDSVMMIRAQPVKSLFQRMARIVRESAAAVGKNVRLRTEGEGTEVDKTVIENLADPLTHMIRNAVDHGLEPPEERMAAGKPAQGVVTLSAGHRSGRVVITVSDDGSGINRERVRQIAIDKGLIAENAELSDNEIDNLLFLPGFSTASEVSDLSGRGVGMDVVRSAIQALSGRITIHSRPGEGTTFTISLPLTLAVLDGMVVEAAGQTLVVPLNTISETLTLGARDIRVLGPETRMVQIRDTFVQLFDLGAEMGFRPPLESFTGKVVLLVALEDESRAALVIDGIVDQRQVVIKGLQDTFGRVPGVAAATILGDGKIALILDPADIVANSRHKAPNMQADLSLAG